MSYARFGNSSDVYVFAHVNGYIACCGCLLDDKDDYHSPEEIVTHLQEHVTAGHQVPDHLLNPSLYPAEDFIPVCPVWACHQKINHAGDHSKHRASNSGRNCLCGEPVTSPVHRGEPFC